MSNNKSRAAISLQESWASNISDYILLRRRQTYSAYGVNDSNTNIDINQIDKKEDNSLFTALFTMLASQLEEGHTVLIIEANEDEQPIRGQINSELIALYGWQQQLLEMLAAPILALIDNQTDILRDNEVRAESSLFTSLDMMFKNQSRIWAPLSLTNYEKEIHNKRFNMVIALYHSLKNTDLVTFIQTINDQPLFINGQNITDTNSLSKEKPIIYQSNNKKEKTILTLWLHRTWKAELNLTKNINKILNQKIEPLKLLIPDNLNKQQVTAINTANNNAFSIITGGPGTGKTYTIAQLVIALQQAKESGDSKYGRIRFSTDTAALALAAPTGKAAQRMQESLQTALDATDAGLQLQEAKTIHRLLGIGRTGKPRYNAKNPLGEDIIIVDEASMLGVELANYLVSAIKPGARLILLGDANQLAAVDAGAVLADLCRIPLLQPIHAELTESRRFSSDSGIGKLAYQINHSKADIQEIWQLLKHDKALSFQYVNTLQPETIKSTNLTASISNSKKIKEISENYLPYIKEIEKITKDKSERSTPKIGKDVINSLMEVFNKFRVLSAGHNGKWGDYYINNYLTKWHLEKLKLPLGQNTWFHGRPIMILQNDYELGLFNGDIGFCLQTSEDANQLEVFFENKLEGIAINLLNEEVIATAYAMTIHKSQGSEFEHVAITFDNSHARLLSKELIYTAVTRAKKQVTIYSTKHALETAIRTPTERHTGLALQFSNLNS